MEKCFVVISGLPGSGKSTLAQRLAPALRLALIDKDVILERLFEAMGAGDAEWRRALSRESDVLLEEEAKKSEGAILVSHWHVPGMPSNSGTPTAWISGLPAQVVNVHCECPVEIAAERFFHRKRHPGHLDHERSFAEIFASLRDAARFESLKIGPRIEVDTSQAADVDRVLQEITAAVARYPQID